MTGRGRSDGAAGATTVSDRQSSPIGVRGPVFMVRVRRCGATGPNADASRTPDHGCGGRGARNRPSPAVDAA